MKTRKFSKTFDLKKTTVANLTEIQQQDILGGNSATACMATDCVSYCIECTKTCFPTCIIDMTCGPQDSCIPTCPGQQTCAVSPAACAVIIDDHKK